jgi:Flp pilus assembly protein TadG
MALVLPVLVMILGGLLDFGNYYAHQLVLTNAARDGARLAAMKADSAVVNARVKDAASAAPVSGNVVVAAGTCAAAGTAVKVSVTLVQPFSWMVLKAFSIPTPVPKGEATMTCA